MIGCLGSLLSLYHSPSGSSAFGELIRTSLGNPEAMPRLISRHGFIAEARSEGIRVPDTIAISDEETLGAAIAILGFPIVIKSDGSWGGEGVAIARNAAEARSAYDRLKRAPSRLRSVARALKRRDPHFLHEAVSPVARRISAQRFVAGRPAASAFAAWRGDDGGDLL